MNPRSLVAEGIGSFALVLVATGVVLVSESGAGAGGNLVTAIASGLVVAAAVAALGGLSGGHFNPLVTLGLGAAGRLDSRQILPYVASQLAGAGLAVLLLAYVASLSAAARRTSLGQLAQSQTGPVGSTMAGGLLIEAVAAALLLVVLIGAQGRRANAALAPVVYGAAFAALMLLTLPLATSALNPARALVLGLIAGSEPLFRALMVSVAGVTGAVLGGVIGRHLHEE